MLKRVRLVAQHVSDALRGAKPAAVAKLEASLQAQMSREVVSAVNDERRRTDVSPNHPRSLPHGLAHAKTLGFMGWGLGGDAGRLIGCLVRR